MSESGEAAWQGSLEHLFKVRKEADAKRVLGDHLGAESMLLSAYITAISNLRSHTIKFTGIRKFRALIAWLSLAEYHSWMLYANLETLNHDQLDVLATWFVHTARGPIRRYLAIRTADLGLYRARQAYVMGHAKAHQLALAHITFARAHMLYRPAVGTPRFGYVTRNVSDAINLEAEIHKEADQTQALRQFVRVLKSAGEVDFACGPKFYVRARRYLNRALLLAEGEADTESQAAQIRVARAKIPT